jgi:PAS domain S-box-containing protein
MTDAQGIFRNIFESVSDGLIYLDKKGIILDLNETAVKIYGGSKKDLLGKHFKDLEIISGKDIPQILKRFAEALTKRVPALRLDITNKKGQRISLECFTNRVRDGKKTTGLVVIAHDITEKIKMEEALHESEERFHQLSEAAFEGIAIGEKGKVLEVNDQLLRILGYERSEMIGMNAMDFVAPESRELVMNYIISKYEAPYEHLALRKDGSIFPVEVHGKSLPYKGRLVRVTAIRDITERKKSEKAIKESEGHYRSLIETIPHGVQENDLNGTITFSSNGHSRIYGYNPGELIGKKIWDLVSSDEEKKSLPKYLEYLKKEQPDPTPYGTRGLTKDGNFIDVQVDWSYKRDSKGQLVGFTSVITDITERKKAEDSLGESEERFRKIFEEGPLGMMLTDFNLNFIKVNSTLSRMLGYTQQELQKLSFPDITHPDDVSKDIENAKKLMKGQIPFYKTVKRYIRKDNDFLWISLTATLIRDEAKGPLYFLTMVEDITERKKTEDEIRESHQRLLTILDGINALVYVTDMQTYELLFVNKFGRDVWGDIAGKICWQTLQEGQKGPCSFCTNKYLVDKKGNPTGPYEWEFQNTINNRWYFIIDRAIEWLDGQIVRLEIATDITDNKTSREALRKSEEKFRSLIETSPDSVVIVDGRTDLVVEVNESMCQLLGFSREEMIGNRTGRNVAPGYREAYEKAYQKHKKTGKFHMELELIRKDGTRVPVDVVGSSFGDFHYGIARDITERKKAEEALLESEERFRKYVESSPTAHLQLFLS